MKNRTLNRPMFRRGGKVDSRGTGITSGLMPKRGFVDGPGGYAGKKSTVDYNVMGIEQPETQITQPKESGTGYFNSPFYKYVDAPIVQAFGGLYNPASSAINTIGKLFGQDDITPYIKSNISDPNLGPQLVSKDEYYNRNKTTTDVPEAETNENVNVSMDPKPEPTVENKNQELITLDDLNLIEEEISSQSDMFEKLLAGDRKDDIFRALTKAAPKLLDEDYGGAIETAGEALDRGDSKQKAKELALKQYLDGQDLGETGKTIKALQKLNPDITSDEILSRLFDKTGASQPIENVRAALLDDFQPDTDHEALHKTGYVEFYAQSTKYPGLQLVRYESVKPGEPDKGFKQPKLTVGAVNFDPTTKKYIVFDGTNSIEYTNPKEAFDSLK